MLDLNPGLNQDRIRLKLNDKAGSGSLKNHLGLTSLSLQASR
jgi:hypothetical protein